MWTRAKISILVLSILTPICLMSSACTLGPRVRTETIVIRPGRPLLVTENVTVTGQVVGSDQIVKQDIGGWMAMPQEHFEALKRAVEGTQ